MTHHTDQLYYPHIIRNQSQIYLLRQFTTRLPYSTSSPSWENILNKQTTDSTNSLYLRYPLMFNFVVINMTLEVSINLN